MLTAFEIAKWMDDKEFPLIECFNRPTDKGFGSQQEFLDALSQYAQDIIESNSSGWSNEYGHINLSRCIKGLKGLDASSEAVQGVLSALAKKIKASRCELEAQHIGNSLYGLQNMDASSGAAQGVLLSLAEKIKVSRCELNAQAIGSSLYGLLTWSSKLIQTS